MDFSNLEQAWQSVLQLLKDHGIKLLVSLATLAVGAWWGRRRALRQWQRREFLGRINVSLNTFDNGRLLIRTLLEDELENVFLNSAAVQQVLEAAKRTTESDSILPVPKDDCWYYHNFVLNEISERFAQGAVRRDMGLAVTCRRYLICLTCEAAGDMRTRKVRAMVIQKETLFNLPDQLPDLESASHKTRHATLKQLAEAYKTRPERFLEVEICV